MSESQSRPSGVRGILTAVVGPLTWRNAAAWMGVLLAVFTIRWLIFEPYSIPTGSMEPTLHGDPRWFRGDHVGVNKWIYGPRVPFMNKRIFHWREPQRWDIVVFNKPKAEHPVLIKRVVGLPGERIHIQDGKILVNNVPVEPPEELRDILHYTRMLVPSDVTVRRFFLYMAKHQFRSDKLNPEEPGVKVLFKELDDLHGKIGNDDPYTLPDDKVIELTKPVSSGSMDTATRLLTLEQAINQPLLYGVSPDDKFSVVPDNCYLLLGDNSGESADGRVWGWMPNDNIMGKAFGIWWPLGRLRDFTGFSRTWWGRGLMFGVPALVAAYEIVHAIRTRKRRTAMPDA